MVDRSHLGFRAGLPELRGGGGCVLEELCTLLSVVYLEFISEVILSGSDDLVKPDSIHYHGT